jgi:ubiquinone/menaquinone biosynthesis C-methylase UbiE
VHALRNLTVSDRIVESVTVCTYTIDGRLVEFQIFDGVGERTMMLRALILLVMFGGFVVSAADVDAQETEKTADVQSADQTSEESVDAEAKPGINDRFLDPELDVSQWLARFEIESREVYSARERVLDACAIKPGFTVADIGAGTGFFSRLFASAVGEEGWVYAVDISARFLEHINRKSQEDEVSHVTSVLCTDRSVRLPPNSVDVAFICDTYHHFEHPQATLGSIHQALKPGGTLVVIDFERIPGESREFIIGHVRAGKEVFQGEVIEAGFRFVEEIKIPTFKENYFLRFRKE